MTGSGRRHGWALEGIGPPTWEPEPPTWEPGPANEFFPTKVFFTDINCPVSSAVRVVGLR
jgi:hypothetical protein